MILACHFGFCKVDEFASHFGFRDIDESASHFGFREVGEFATYFGARGNGLYIYIWTFYGISSTLATLTYWVRNHCLLHLALMPKS